MIVNFAKADMKNRPNFILRNLDGTAIAHLGCIINPTSKLCYNEISEIEFEYPSQIEGMKLKEYDLLTGMRVIDVENYGQFLLRNPEENNDGIVKKKTCVGYSLEYEFTYKSISLDEGTYNFWNPVTPDSTIIGIIRSQMPSWGIGKISKDLIGKYRTFSIDSKNIYDFMKSDLQKTYECIFYFDTYERTINVRSVKDIVRIKPVYLSTKNLLKNIEINENTEDLVTVLDVYGAEGVDIRNVNPMGQNRIYNLDSFMTTDYFSESMIAKWNNWKNTFANYQQVYYNYTIEQTMQISKKAVESAALTELKNELSTLETKRSTILQAMAIDEAAQKDLDSVKREITAKENDIKLQEGKIKNIEASIEGIIANLKKINQITSFSSFFSNEEITILDRYFKCGSLTDSSFVASSVDSYATDIISKSGLSTIFSLSDIVELIKAQYDSSKTFYTIRGGRITQSSLKLNAEVVKGTFEFNSDYSFIASFYLNSGTINDDKFPGATLSLSGSLRSNVSSSSNTFQFRTSSATLYMTKDVSEYQKMSIEWELYDYGVDCLKKLSSPTYSFKVESANFLALEDFIEFTKGLELGEKIYLNTDDLILCPILVSVSIDFDDLTKLELDFGDAYHLNDIEFSLEALLDKSISMGNSLDFNQYNYSNFVTSGAKTSVQDFMDSALDTMRNMILSGVNNEITIDQSGLRCRKYDEASDTYDPNQIWIAHNALMFTSDNWESAEIGIGQFVDKNLGSVYGVIAPAIVGTILAGSNLVIESQKQDGGVCVFKVDAEGASLHNASFNLYGSSGGRIDLGATFGIVGGANKNTMFAYNSKGQPIGVRTTDGRTITSLSDLYSGDTPIANFWLDMNGNVYFRGKIIATSGSIGGWEIASSYLYSGSGSTRVALNGGTSYYSEYAIWAGADNPSNAKFWVKKDGTFSATNGVFSGELKAATGTFSGNLNAAGGTFKGALQAATGTFTGALQAATGTFSGALQAATGNFKGIVQASDFLDSSGRSMMNGSKFASDYLDLHGITIRDSSNNISFQVAQNGTVTINGKVTMGSGSSINWGTVTNVNSTQAPGYNIAVNAQSTANNAVTVAGTAQSTADAANRAAANAQRAADAAAALARTAQASASGAIDTATQNAKDLVRQLANGVYFSGTFIDGTTVTAPTLAGNIMVSGTFVGNRFIAEVGSGNGGGFVLSTQRDGDVFHIWQQNYVGPEVYIQGRGTLWFDGWDQVKGITATFA